MRKAEMNEKQLKERITVIHTLAANGWNGRKTNQLIDEGYWFDAEAVMDYQNDGIELVIQYCAEDNSVDFSINQDSDSLDFVIKFESKIKEVLDNIVGFQNKISLRNYKTYIREIIKICPLTYIVLDGDLVQIIDNKSESDGAG
jgi:hypothetical protein